MLMAIQPEPRFSKDGIIAHTLNTEAGYVNDPNDSGGETNHGCTSYLVGLYRDDWAMFDYNGDMSELPRSLASHIIDREFWHRYKLDDVHESSPLIASTLFDVAVNAGGAVIIKALQVALNTLNRKGRDYEDQVVDGIIGSTTIRCLKALIDVRGNAGIRAVLQCLISAQTTHYLDISIESEKNETFFFGWVLRSYSMMAEYNKAIEDGWFE